MPDDLRSDLPALPSRMRRLRRHRGYPVPWFVADVDGVPDFRIADARKMRQAVKDRLCWICGAELTPYSLYWPIGPMCAINRTISEPPSHHQCALYAVKACPFLIQQESRRRPGGLPKVLPPAGEPIMRQPGVICLWQARSYTVWPVDNGILFRIGDPVSVAWFREGRAATRAEILESIESGYPILHGQAELDGPEAIVMLQGLRDRALQLLPKA